MTTRIYLIGLRGTGKTTVARLLAERLGWSWFDADVEVERTFGTTIRQIFQDEGETAFRDKEAHILETLSQKEHAVIACGGGVILRPENRECLKQGFVAWLTAKPEVLWQRMQQDATTEERRPNLGQGGLAEIESLLEQRRKLYEECADWMMDTSDVSPDEVARKLGERIVS